MRPRRTSAARRALALAALALCGSGAAPAARAQSLNLGEILSEGAAEPAPSGAEILRRALDNLYGFDAGISVMTQRRPLAGGAGVTSEFLIQRRRAQGAQRLLVVSLRPPDVRGTRVLQLDYDDGREETFAFLPSMGGEPMPTRYRLAELFLGTWQEIAEGEPEPMGPRPAEYEVLGLEPQRGPGEPTYLLTVRPLAARGYDWAQLVVARSDYAILEQRQYFASRTEPALVYTAPREGMVRVGDHIVPGQIRYRDLADNSEIEVQLRHAPLSAGNDALFFPRTFHRIPLSELSQPAGR